MLILAEFIGVTLFLSVNPFIPNPSAASEES